MRLKIFREYRDFRLLKSQTSKLAIQQEFLKEYFTNEDNYKKLKVFYNKNLHCNFVFGYFQC